VPAALTGAVGYALRLAQEASFAAYLQRVGNTDLKPGRYSILMLMAENPGLTPTALARVAGRDKSTLTATLRDLETARLIARERDAKDRRSYAVRLTPAGRELLGRLRRHAAAHDAMLDAIVGPDKPVLMAALERIARALAEDAGRVVPLPLPPAREG
jgi:DNA-binding MarR family transcriptional regulator